MADATARVHRLGRKRGGLAGGGAGAAGGDAGGRVPQPPIRKLTTRLTSPFHFSRACSKPAMSRARTFRLSTAGRRINSIDCRRSQPISSAAFELVINLTQESLFLFTKPSGKLLDGRLAKDPGTGKEHAGQPRHATDSTGS
jgi:hypothetical protein